METNPKEVRPEFYIVDPAIYPRKVWVAVGTNCFKERFDGLEEMSECIDAQCAHAYDREAKLGGIFVRFKSIESMTVRNITHESLHAALMIYEYIDCKVEIDNQEHICYLTDYIAANIDKVREAEMAKRKAEGEK